MYLQCGLYSGLCSCPTLSGKCRNACKIDSSTDSVPSHENIFPRTHLPRIRPSQLQTPSLRKAAKHDGRRLSGQGPAARQTPVRLAVASACGPEPALGGRTPLARCQGWSATRYAGRVPSMSRARHDAFLRGPEGRNANLLANRQSRRPAVNAP